MTEVLQPANQALQAALFALTADGVLIADAHGRLTQINPAACALLAVAPNDVIGRAATAVFSTYPALINLFVREGEQVLDVRVPRRRLAHGVARTLPDGSRLVLLHDVTEQREVETRREALLSALAHDLRNPVSAMIGFIDLASKTSVLDEQQAYFLDRARQTGTKLYETLDVLLDIAWIEAGMPIAHAPVQLDALVQAAIALLAGEAQARGIGIAVSMQSPMPPVVGDETRLRQMIAVILRNAIHYSEPERLVAVHAWSDTQDVYCAIADQGYGIADEELERVFDRFYRGNDERIRAWAGGGLGLTFARRVVARHGGVIWASSNAGKGSTFTFMLPVGKD
jgi:signal transduction histidine kinase